MNPYKAYGPYNLMGITVRVGDLNFRVHLNPQRRVLGILGLAGVLQLRVLGGADPPLNLESHLNPSGHLHPKFFLSPA